MKKIVKITHIGETKEGVSQKTGKEWALTDIDVKWTVEHPGQESYEQSCVGSVRGWVNDAAVRKCIAEETEVTITMYVSVRVWNDKHFTNVEIYLPKEMMFDAKPL